MEILALESLLCLLVNPRVLPNFQPNKNLIWLVIIFLFSAIIASILGADLIKSIFGNHYRADGLLTLFHLAALFFFLVLFWNKKWEYPTIVALSSGSIVLSFWTVISAVLLRFSAAIGATFGQPVFLAGYLVATLPLTFYLASSLKIKLFRALWGIFFLIQISAIIATRAWGGIVGIIFFLIIWSMTNSRLERSKKAVFSFLLSIVLVISGLYYQKTQNNLGFLPEGRSRIIHRILLGISRRPILGYGWANADYAFEAVPWPIYFQHDVYVDKAHFSLLEVLAATGIVGLSIYSALILKTVSILIKDKTHRPFLLVFILFLFHSQTNVISIAEETIFWLIAGISASRS